MPTVDKFATRQDAKARGLKLYQGKPCARLHDGVRYASNNSCAACAANYSQADHAARKNERTAQKRAYRARLKGNSPALGKMIAPGVIGAGESAMSVLFSCLQSTNC